MRKVPRTPSPLPFPGRSTLPRCKRYKSPHATSKLPASDWSFSAALSRAAAAAFRFLVHVVSAAVASGQTAAHMEMISLIVPSPFSIARTKLHRGSQHLSFDPTFAKSLQPASHDQNLLTSDKLQRTMGLYSLAKEWRGKQTPEFARYLEAFCYWNLCRSIPHSVRVVVRLGEARDYRGSASEPNRKLGQRFPGKRCRPTGNYSIR